MPIFIFLSVILLWFFQCQFKLQEFLKSKRNSNFRLWLTTESNDYISSHLLEISLKVVYEVPPGIKNNMKRIYAQWQQCQLSFNAAHLQCLFMLAWLHSLLQERRMFIPEV